MSKVQIVWFRDLVRWDTEYFTGNHRLESKFKLVDLSEILIPRKERIKPNEYDGITPIVAKIPFSNPNIELRKEPKTKMDMYAAYRNDLLVSNINFHQGAVAICRENKVFASTHYQPYIVNTDNIDLEFLVLVLRQNSYQQYIGAKKIRGIKTESNFNFIKTLQIPLPPLEIQKQIVAKIQSIKAQIKALQDEEKRLKDEIEAYIYIALGLEKKQEAKRQKVFIVRFKDLDRWDTRHNQSIAINLCHTDSIPYHTEQPNCHTDSASCHTDTTSPCHTEAIAEVSTNIESKTRFFAVAQNDNESKRDISAQYDKPINTANLKALLDSIPTPPSTGWEVKTLGEICEINPKIDFKELTKLEKEVSFLPMEAVKTDGRTFEKFQRKAKEAQGFTKFADNDLLWAKITPCMQNKKSLVVSGLKNGFGFGSTEFFVLRSKDSRQINIHFILQFLRLDLILQSASETFKGSAGQQRVPKEFLQNLKIPLPPLSVQEKILAHIHKIESSIANTQDKVKALGLELTHYIESTL